MRIRLAFVSNSSSEAFILEPSDITVSRVKSDLVDLIAVYNKIKGSNVPFEEMFKEPRIANSEDVRFLSNWMSYERGHYSRSGEFIEGELCNGDIAAVTNKIVIYSTSDNTIPFGIMEFIEDIYPRCRRLHLG